MLNRCLELLGFYEIPEETRNLLVAQARKGMTLPGTEEFDRLVGRILQLIVATPEYQFV